MKAMQPSEFRADVSLVPGELTESWAKEAQNLDQKETVLGATLHKMSQQVTVMLTTLELTQMMGEVLPEDIEILLNAATELRDYLKLLRANAGSNNAELGQE